MDLDQASSKKNLAIQLRPVTRVEFSRSRSFLSSLFREPLLPFLQWSLCEKKTQTKSFKYKMVMSHLFLSSPRPSLAPRLHSPTQFYSNNSKSFKLGNEAKASKRLFLCRSIHMESDHSGDSKRLTFDTLLRKAKDVWNDSPKPVKEFPWNRAFENFVQLVLDLAVSVVKLLFVPVLAVSSVSEMSYCAHERKLALVPFPLVIGIVVGGIVQGTALNISPRLKEAEVPWHLIALMVFFTLIKLPGPYYPYWGRLLIPHFVNGVLVRALWSMFFWYKKTRNTSGGTPLQNQTK